jgi:hypothetical protein
MYLNLHFPAGGAAGIVVALIAAQSRRSRHAVVEAAAVVHFELDVTSCIPTFSPVKYQTLNDSV